MRSDAQCAQGKDSEATRSDAMTRRDGGFSAGIIVSTERKKVD
jgi:hypothetical protein